MFSMLVNQHEGAVDSFYGLIAQLCQCMYIKLVLMMFEVCNGYRVTLGQAKPISCFLNVLTHSYTDKNLLGVGMKPSAECSCFRFSKN